MFAISQITPEDIKVCFPPQTPRENIEKYWPVIQAALVEFKLTDKPMVCMALATIRAESESFAPISEHRSLYNTKPNMRPFGLYEGRRDLGNVCEGDGELYRGRGFVQLTGRANYKFYGKRIGIDLVQSPDLANEPGTAALVLAAFLAERQKRIRLALENKDMGLARKLVNGGQHGVDRFVDTYSRAVNRLEN